ncbi:hypothetical protein P175DRAFT_0531552 [Aspergillus ochraceoroseus IBT 24754]|uniref:Fido domain-containing protein n=1 Tax=Aspergillus ochraceoroseus IBT 24754 TaxID=1392256 RepID=A0A2T5M0E4_9EURO|nr:uncharacterized protein P175DRAFT_0531552 [Aspergillus ochraceoroseus IBT 24754]PTU22007.1 hypothetical protein P175DRAFT_0531552 [Aspergillus ochraceoroseus IBT 24754]
MHGESLPTKAQGLPYKRRWLRKSIRFLSANQVQRLHGLWMNPTDGNKRTALLAADMFLNINGHRLQNVPFADDPFNKAALADAHVGRPSSSEISTSHFAKPLEQFTP